jgi:flagellar assembly factor FliW
MKFKTPRWGEIEVSDDKVLSFATGLAGFPDCSRFIVMDHDRQTPLKWLQGIDRPELAFLIVEPEQILAKYEVEVPEQILKNLGWGDDIRPADVAVFVILTAGEDTLTANLRAPIIVNIANRKAFQLILDDADIPLRYAVAPSTK